MNPRDALNSPDDLSDDNARPLENDEREADDDEELVELIQDEHLEEVK